MYDSAGNPILELSGSCDELISKLQHAKDLEESLYRTEAKKNTKAKLGEMNDTARGLTTDYRSKYGSDSDQYRELVKLEQDRAKAIQKVANAQGAEKQAALNNLQSQIDKINEWSAVNTQAQNDYKAELAARNSDVRGYMNEQVGAMQAMKGASKELSTGMKDFVNSLDFSQIQPDKLNQVEAAMGSIAEAAKGGKLDLSKLNADLTKLNEGFASGSIDLPKYNKGIEDLVNSVNKVTGVDKDILRNLFTGVDADIAKTDTALSKFNANAQKTVESLAKMEQSTNNKVRKNSMMDLFNDKDTSSDVKAQIMKSLKDGKVSNDEIEMAMKIAVDPEIANEDQVHQKLKGLIEGLDGIKGLDAKTKASIELDVATGDLDGLKQTLDDLPEDKQIQVLTEIAESGTMTMEQLVPLVEGLPEDKQIEVLTHAEGGDAIKELSEYLDGIPEAKEIKMDIIKNFAEGDVDGLLESIESLPEEKQLEIIGNFEEAHESISEIDAKKLEDKRLEIEANGADEVNATLQEIDANSGDKSQTVTTQDNGGQQEVGILQRIAANVNSKFQQITTNDNGGMNVLGILIQIAANVYSKFQSITTTDNGGSSVLGILRNIIGAVFSKSQTITTNDSGGKGVLGTLQSIAASVKNRTQTITTIFKTIGKAVKGFFGGSSKTEATNISDTPEEAEAESMTSKAKVVGDVSSSPNEVNDTPSDTSGTMSAKNSNGAFGSIDMSTDTRSRADLSDYNRVIKYVKEGINLLEELEQRIKSLSNSISLIDAKMEHATDEEKISYLKQQNELLAQQAEAEKNLYDEAVRTRGALQNELRTKGFEFDSNGNIDQYEETLLRYQQEYERLNKEYEEASKAASNYEGKDEGTKKNLQSQADAARDRADAAKEEYDNVRKLSDEYNSLNTDKIADAELAWQECNNKIQDNLDEIKELEDKIERADFDKSISRFKNALADANNELDKMNNKLDMLDVKLDTAYGQDRLNIMKEQLDVLEQQRAEQEKTIRAYRGMEKEYQNKLGQYGFQFDEAGNISNLEENLNALEGSEDYEKINEYLEEYLDLVNDDLPDAELQLAKLNREIYEVNEERLKATQEIEEQITDMIEDQIKKRKQAIKDLADEQVKALEKQKKAYQDYRKEVEYNNDFDDQNKKVQEIQAQINRLEKDDSLANRKKLQDLYDQLEEEQKKLSEITQEHLDDSIENMFDDQIDNIEEKADKQIEDLENKWTDAEIAKLVQKSLQDGVFYGIDGEISSLQDAIVSFAEESGDALGVMGDIVKNDLISNLNTALDTMENINDVYNQMGIQKVEPVQTSSIESKQAPQVNVDSVTYNIKANDTEGIMKELEDKNNELLTKLANSNR